MQPTTDINDFGQVNYIYKEIKEDSVSSLEEVKNKKQNNILSHSYKKIIKF